MILTAVLIFAGILASGLMEKFATESVGWFRFQFTYFDPRQNSRWLAGFWKQLLLTGLVQPLAFHWILLRRFQRTQELQYVLSYILAGFLSGILRGLAGMEFLHLAPGKELPVWLSIGIYSLVIFGSGYFFFGQSRNKA